MPSRSDYEALRRALTAAGLDPDYWNYDDIDTMATRGYTVETMVRLAIDRETGGRRSA